jgi:hypothetical protein
MALSDSALDRLCTEYDIDRGTAYYCADSLQEGGSADEIERNMRFQHGWDEGRAKKFVQDLRQALVAEKLIAG